MALLTWRKRDPQGKASGPTLYLDFDATLLEEFTRSAEVTRFPVENGSVLTDHYQPQPRAITLEVQVSDTPTAPRPLIDGKESAINEPVGYERPLHLDLPVNRAIVSTTLGLRAITARASRVSTKRTASVLQFDGEVYRTVDAFLMLDDLMQTGQLVDVLLFREGEVEYKDMVIVNVRTPRDAAAGSTLTFTIDLVQITFANTETGEAPEPSAPEHRAPVNAGNRNGKTDSQAQAQDDAVDLGYNTSG